MRKIFTNGRHDKNVSRLGFTLIELLITIGITSSLLGYITMNLLGAQNTTSLTAVLEALNADMKSQQVKAMNGATSGGSAGDFGIYLEPDKYILFRGQTYNPGDTTNFPVSMDSNIQLSSTFPNNTIVFSIISGEIVNFSISTNTITLKNTSNGGQTTMTVNRYGVATNVQ